MGGFTFYETIYNDYNTVLVTASNNAANQLIGAIGPYLISALILVVIIFGIAMIFQKVDQGEGAMWIIRALFIANLLTPAAYNQWVMTMAQTTIPGALSAALGVPAITPAVQFDHLQSDVEKITAALDASAGWWNVSAEIRITLAYYFATIPLFIGFCLSIIVMAFVSIVAPAGAVMLVFYLFNGTRHFAERWIGKLISLMILQLFIDILMNVILTEFGMLATRLGTNANSGDLHERIAILWDYGLGFFIGIMLLIGLPIIAGYIGGGQVTSMVQAPARMAATLMGRFK
jgi:type IV secretion system protein VirB6